MRAIKILKANASPIHNGTTALTICTLELTAPVPPKKSYPNHPSVYGEFLKQARLDNGLTRLELALELDVYESTIDKWERGKTMPNSENKQKIINYLGYDPMQKTITI